MNDWYEMTIGSVATLRKGISYKSEDYCNEGSGYPFITIKCFVKGGGYEPSGLKYFDGYFTGADQIFEGDILFSITDLTRAGDIVGSPLRVPSFGEGRIVLASMDCIKITPIDGLCDKDFLYHRMMLSDIRRQMVAYSAGSTVLHLDTKKVPKITIHIPKKVSDQKAIADLLDITDRTIAHTEALIGKYQQIKAGLVHDLFTRGIGADSRLRPPREQAPELYQESAIGWIPKEWGASRLKDILKDSGGYIQTGPFGSQLHAHEYTFEGVPFVMPQNINNGKIDEADIARIVETRAQSLYRHRLKIGDIIIARRGELSRAAAITELEQGWVCGSGCFLLRLGGSNLDARFFSLMYRHALVQRQVAGLAVGSTMPSLNNEIMGKLVFPCMSKTEQTAITDRVELAEAKITTLELELAKLRKQKSGLMQDLLTGKVPVNVDLEEVAHV